MSKRKTNALLIALIILSLTPFAYRIYSIRPQSKYLTKEITAPVGDLGLSIDYVSKTVVRITCNDVIGSGNIWRISPTYIDVITAGHVTNNGGDCDITFYDGLSVKGSVISSNKEKDVALIRVKIKELKKAAKAQDFNDSFDYESVRPVKNAPLPHDDIFIMDSASGTASVGTIEALDQYIPDFDMNMIYCLCDVDPGMSGSGLFDNKGHYLGILLGGSEEGCVCLSVDDTNL